jgi:hypothetical protein
MPSKEHPELLGCMDVNMLTGEPPNITQKNSIP